MQRMIRLAAFARALAAEEPFAGQLELDRRFLVEQAAV
jgi:hypothetical protein